MRPLVAACVLVVLLPPVAAQAGERVEGFDGFLPGATITNQVSGASFPESPQVFDPVHTSTFSSPHALRKPAPCNDYQCDNGAYRMTINFPDPASQVQVRVGNDEGGCFEFCPLARMVAYSGENATGSIVADSLAYGPRPLVQEPNQYGPITVQLTATASGYQIRSVRVFTGREEDVPGEVFSGPVRVQLDDLRFIVEDPGDPPPPPPPPPPTPPSVGITEPSPGTVTDRTDLFVRGSIVAPGGLVARCVSVDAPDTFPADCPGTDRVGAYTEFVRGLSVGPHTLTVWARDAHGQVGKRSVEVEIVRNLGADIAVELMEPIQTIQSYDLPELQPDLRRTPAVSYLHRQADYTGVPLARNKRTIVRLHATREAVGAGGDFMPLAFLHGYQVSGGDLSPLPGSPVRPTASPSSLPGGTGSDSAEAIGVRRAQDNDPYTFELPYAWTRGRVLLVGEVNRPGLPSSRSECDGCLEDNAYALQVQFADGGSTTVWPIWLNYPGVRLPGTLGPFYTPPFQAFYRTYQIAPFRIEVRPYQALIDVSDLAARSNPGNNATMSDVVERVQETKDTMGLPDHTIGLHDGVFRSVARTVDNAGFLDIFEENAAQVDVTRPLQAVGHELVHLMGTPLHAGTRCPADADPGDWPPDQMGLIQGWGIDVTGVRGRLKVFGQASAGLFDPGPATTDFDLMSYCVTDRDSEESDTWMSVRRWTGRFLRVGGGGGLRTARSTGTAAVDPGPLTDVIRVEMQLAPDGSLQIVDTTRGLGRAVGTGGSLTVNLLNGAGDVIRSGGVVRFADHIHEPEGPIPDTFVATVPVGGGAPGSVEAENASGTVLAERSASQRPPAVRLRSPEQRGRPQRVRGALKMHWSASDPDGDPLSTRIDLSTNDGRTWRPVALNVTGERFRVPAQLLQRTRRGRVRVMVEDGFRQAEAVSRRLRIDGIRPQVVIQNPVRGQRLAADARLNLVGQAFNDAGRELRGRALRWISRGHRLGRGAALSVLAAEVGKRVTLIAKDRFGRRGRASVRVRVVRVPPVFTRLSAPKSLRRGAQRLKITVGSSLPGIVKVKGRGVRRTRARVGPVAERVTIPVRTRKPLRLRVSLRALGRTTKTRLRVARR